MYTREFGTGSPLSPREKEACRLSLTLACRKDIAGAMGIQPYTLDGYFKIIYLKLGIHTRFELMHRLYSDPALLD